MRELLIVGLFDWRAARSVKNKEGSCEGAEEGGLVLLIYRTGPLFLNWVVMLPSWWWDAMTP